MTDVESRGSRPPVPVPDRTEGERPGSPIGLALLVGLVVLAGVGGGWPLLVVIGAIVVMIFLHELGHYLTAKWAGMKVTEFFIGFGPRIWSFRRGETEYGVKAIPAGAYVKIVGMHNLDEYDPVDDNRTYMCKPYWRRLSVAVAGSTMHFLLALATLFVLFAAIGVPGGTLEPQHGWIVSGEIEPDTPAGEAGIVGGDRILSVDGVDVGSWNVFRAVVAERPGQEVAVVVERAGALQTLTVDLGATHPETGEAIGFFGVAPDFPTKTLGVGAATGESIESFGRLSRATVGSLVKVLSPSGLADIGSRVLRSNEGPAVGPDGAPVSDEQRQAEDDNRPVSIVGIADLGVDLVQTNPANFLYLFVFVNIFIGIFNLVPLLPLDGGHVAIATYEKIRSMLRGGQPYHVDVVKLLPLTYAVVLLLVFLGVSTIYLDIVDPIGG